jgi:MFS family permease
MTSPIRSTVPDRLLRARFGVFGTFFVVGFGLAAWLVNIPFVQRQTGVSDASLGVALLLLGLGGVIGMQLIGYVIQRVGSKVVVVGALAAYVITVNLPAHATGLLSLGIALLIFGVATGAVDVAMNDQAVIVERKYGRPIMSAFHALWSVGGAAGALVGAAVQAAGLQVGTAVLLSSVIAALLGVVCVPQLLPVERSDSAHTLEGTLQRQEPKGTRLPRSVRNRVIGFAVLAFLLMMSEGVANDWAALHAVEHLGRPDSAAALAYATFAVSMTVGRLTIDRVAGRFGPAFVVRYGSLTAAVGILLVMISPVYLLTLIGWAIFGLGLAGVVPQLFSAAGNISTTNQSILLSRVVGAGYVGQLAGPAMVGGAASLIGLNLSFGLPLLFCGVAVTVAPIVSKNG